VYVTAQVTSAVIGTSVSKMFAKSEGVFLYILFALAIVFAAINVVSLIFAATTVDQGVFVPMQTCTTLITNMVTGLIIWQDLNTLGDNLFVYVIMHLIMLLGIWLLAPEDAIAQYKGNINLEVIKGGAMGENPVHRQIRSESNLRLGSVSVDSAASDPGYSRVDPSYIRDAVVGRSATMSNDAWGKSVSQPPPAKRSSVETGATRRPRTRSITMLAVEIAALPLAAISTISPQFSEEQKHAWRHTLTRKNLVGGPTFVALPIHPPVVNLTMPSGVSASAPSACTSAAPPEPLGSPRSRQQVSSSLSAVRETMAESSSENLGQSSSV